MPKFSPPKPLEFNPLTVMDPEFSLKEYIRLWGVEPPGPLVLMDDHAVVRVASQVLEDELPHEACYLEQLWLRVGVPQPWQPGDGKPPWAGGPKPRPRPVAERLERRSKRLAKRQELIAIRQEHLAKP